MASVVTFPNPCLVAILLVCNTRTGSGAQILFHYPPRPLSHEYASPSESIVEQTDDDDTSTDSENSSSDNDDLFALPGIFSKTNTQAHTTRTKSSGEEDEGASVNAPSQQNGSRKKGPEPLFGLAEDGLVSLLAPDRIWHRRKYEMGINDLTFVGRPVFVRSDGLWRKEKKRRHHTTDNDLNASDTATENEELTEDGPKVNLAIIDQTTSGTKSPLTMFHVVFVMNPPPLEHTVRVKDMYDHVIKKFTRILKWEQGRKDYVWKETEVISAVKSAASNKRSSRSALCAEIMSKSSLAIAISNVYTQISSSRVAIVTLTPKVSFSLQIPPVTSTSYLPSLTDPPIPPGLWLTTANDINPTNPESDAADHNDPLQSAKHYTLLLKSPPHRLAKDAIDAGGNLAALLPKFVSSLRPTKSFYKLSVTSQTSLDVIEMLASHLIYWRKAVAIPPLHQKDVYIVSPNADMRKLREATKSYELQFAPTMPNMPSLPKILSILSGTPQTFGSLIPSADHKEIYYLALAWLMRNGWVTQLRTFVYVRVSPDAKRAVKEKERETKIWGLVRQKTQEDGGLGREIARPRKRPSIVSRPSSDGKRSTDSGWPIHHPQMSSLILNPDRASPDESRWLDYIEESLTDGTGLLRDLSMEDREDLQKHWPLFVKYFNGRIAIETIPVREGLKRRFIWSLLGKVGLNPKHGVEDENGANSAILVPVRHW